jgi:hypothetical protein
MKQSKTKYIHSLLPFFICPSILIPLPMHNCHPHCCQCEQIIASRVSHPPHCHCHENRRSPHNNGKAQSGVHPVATAAQMDNNKTQSVICPIITTLPADNDKIQSVVRPVHRRRHANRRSQHNDGKAQSGVHPAATAAQVDNDKTQSVICSVATALPAYNPLLSCFRQAVTSTTKLAAATVLLPPPPLPPHSHDCTSTAYKIKNIILLTNLFLPR